MKQAVINRCAAYFYTIGQNKTALELTGGNAAMQIDSILVLHLPAANGQLVVLDLNIQGLHRKASNRQRNTQAALTNLFNIVGGVAFTAGFTKAVKGFFNLIKTQEERAIEKS